MNDATSHPEPEQVVLAPYSGTDTPCPKCGNGAAHTRYMPALVRRVPAEFNAVTVYRGPLPERLERQCERCEFQWDESLAPQGHGMTVEALAYALDNATPFPFDLEPAVCTHMARLLLESLHISARPDHPMWQFDTGRPHLAPAPELEPAPTAAGTAAPGTEATSQ